MLRYVAAMVFATGLPSVALAQEFDVVLHANPKNMNSCVAGNAVWATKWHVKVSGDTATVSTRTEVLLKKKSPDFYEALLSFGNQGSFSVALNLQEGSLRIANKAHGCVWEN
jgi:hypothetical protein